MAMAAWSRFTESVDRISGHRKQRKYFRFGAIALPLATFGMRSLRFRFYLTLLDLACLTSEHGVERLNAHLQALPAQPESAGQLLRLA
jgi:hypothetical protein